MDENVQGKAAARLSETDLVRAIRRVLSGDAPGVVVGVGDDAAVVEPGEHQLVLSADPLVEGVHFRLETTSAHNLGHKAISVNVSDLAAMGASPRYALVCIAVPRETEPSWIMGFYGGVREAADEYGLGVVGGDTSRAERVFIAPFVVGAVGVGRAVTRRGARPGDRLVVTGSLGAAAGGLRLTQAATREVRAALATDWERQLVAAYERPSARVGEGQILARVGATAMMDISDGLALDLSRLCEESGIGARIQLTAVPVSQAMSELARLLKIDPLDLALHGGEDYELLAAVPPEAVEEARVRLKESLGTPLTEIGEIADGAVVAVDADGVQRILEPRGWDHFA